MAAIMYEARQTIHEAEFDMFERQYLGYVYKLVDKKYVDILAVGDFYLVTVTIYWRKNLDKVVFILSKLGFDVYSQASNFCILAANEDVCDLNEVRSLLN